ncbi:hypothetical protein C0J52_26364, partial [Blattella germanica]
FFHATLLPDILVHSLQIDLVNSSDDGPFGLVLLLFPTLRFHIVMKRAIRIIQRAPPRTHCKPLFIKLGILTLPSIPLKYLSSVTNNSHSKLEEVLMFLRKPGTEWRKIKNFVNLGDDLTKFTVCDDIIYMGRKESTTELFIRFYGRVFGSLAIYVRPLNYLSSVTNNSHSKLEEVLMFLRKPGTEWRKIKNFVNLGDDLTKFTVCDDIIYMGRKESTTELFIRFYGRLDVSVSSHEAIVIFLTFFVSASLAVVLSRLKIPQDIISPKGEPFGGKLLRTLKIGFKMLFICNPKNKSKWHLNSYDNVFENVVMIRIDEQNRLDVNLIFYVLKLLQMYSQGNGSNFKTKYCSKTNKKELAMHSDVDIVGVILSLILFRGNEVLDGSTALKKSTKFPEFSVFVKLSQRLPFGMDQLEYRQRFDEDSVDETRKRFLKDHEIKGKELENEIKKVKVPSSHVEDNKFSEFFLMVPPHDPRLKLYFKPALVKYLSTLNEHRRATKTKSSKGHPKSNCDFEILNLDNVD